MYNRILNRPMFKRGGDVMDAKGTGITSGLDNPRQGYHRGRVVRPGGYNGDERTMPIWEIINRMKKQNVVTPKQKSGAFWEGISQGFGGAKTLSEAVMNAVSAQSAAIKPYEDAVAKKGLMLDELGVKGEFDVLTETIAKEGKSGSKQFDIGADAKTANLIVKFNHEKYELKKELNDENTSEERKLEIEDRDLETVNAVLAEIGSQQSMWDWLQGSQGLMTEFLYYKDDLEAKKNPETGESYTESEAFLEALRYYKKIRDAGKGAKTGGRVGYQQGMNYNMLQDQVTDTIKTPQEQIKMTENITEMQTPSPVQSLSFQELRSRLPQEITDDIVQLLASSEQALIDFATIRTQQDIDAFNQKYDVNLVLPQGA